MTNNRGLTIIEVLISISVASIVIMLLMSLLSSTLITKNEIDYSNQLDSSIYEINSLLSRQFQDMGFKSIKDLTCDDENVTVCEYTNVFLLTTEFTPIIEEDRIKTDRSVFTPYLLVLDVSNDAIYFGELDFDVILDENGEVTNFEDDEEVKNNEAIENFLNNPTRISNPRLIIESGSIEVSECVKFDNRNHIRTHDDDDNDNGTKSCANAFLRFDLNVSFRLQNNNALPPRTYRSTIFY